MFGRDDDILEELVELEIVEGLMACGRCRGRCQCSGRNHLGDLIALEIAEEIIDGDW